MNSSIPPPPKDSSGTKYAAVGLLLLLGGAVGAYFAFSKPAAPTPPVRPPSIVDAGNAPLTPNVAAQIDITSEEVDVPDPPYDAVATGPRIRYVTRYVDACPGTIDVARVDALLAASSGGFRECYNRELRRDPTLHGGATIRFVITPQGTVGDVGTGGIVRTGTFKACFETVLRRLRFPAPRGGCVTKETRFNFSAS